MIHTILFHNLRKVLSLSAIFFLSISFFSCEKDGELNPKFETDHSSVLYMDTTQILVRTIKEDSILTQNSSLSLFGAFKDSVFGISRASFYTQVNLPYNNVDVVAPGDFTVDSVVLSLVYNGKYGDEASHTMEVYQLTNGFEPGETYYSNDSLTINPAALGQKTFTSNISKVDTIIVPDDQGMPDTIAVLPQLRIQLDHSIGNAILNETPEGALSNNSAFHEFIKGFYITPSPASPQNYWENNILYFALTNSQSKLTVFFTENSSNTKKKLDLPITTSSARFNRFKHSYTGTPVAEHIAELNVNDSAYLQSMAGVRPVVTFPELMTQLPQKDNFVINKAELVLPVITGTYSDYGLPDKIVLLTTDSAGNLIYTPDINEPSGYVGGTYNKSDQSYRFNIARYIHGLINEGNPDKGLTFIINGSAVNSQRVIFAGPNNRNRRMKLNLHYSKLE